MDIFRCVIRVIHLDRIQAALLAHAPKPGALARLFGANKEYIERGIPHISSLMKPRIEDVIDVSDVIVIGKKEDEYRVLADKLDNGRVVVDLVRMFERTSPASSYQGMCW